MLRPLAAAAFALSAVVAGLGACSGTSSTTLPPTTGIVIRADSLTSGKGCGVEPSQVYKYAVVVLGYSGSGDPSDPASYSAPVTSNLFDCYADGSFISLPTTNGSASFRLEVFAYNRAAYEAARAAVDAATTVGLGRTPEDRARLAGYSGELRASGPTWTTECTATQQDYVQALASCRPLAAGSGGVGGDAGVATITLDTSRFTLPDGRTARCAPGAADGGAPDGGDAGDLDAGADASDEDAGADAGDDAGSEAGAGDAGAGEITFAGVRVRTRVGAQILAEESVGCPASYTVEVPPEPARFDLDVGLLDPAGAPVEPAAVTHCTATVASAGSVSAVCP